MRGRGGRVTRHGGSPRFAASRGGAALIVACGMVVALTGCGQHETPEQRVTRLRQQFEVRPTAVQSSVAEDGTSRIALDVLVLNKGRETLDHLTFLMRVLAEDGSERLSRPVSLDTSEVLAGVTSQVTALVSGVELREGETVQIELEPYPSAAERATYPEYRAALSSPE